MGNVTLIKQVVKYRAVGRPNMRYRREIGRPKKRWLDGLTGRMEQAVGLHLAVLKKKNIPSTFLFIM